MEEVNYIMKYAGVFTISWFEMPIIEPKQFYTNGLCTHMHWDKIVLDDICYQGNNKLLLNQTIYEKYYLSKILQKNLRIGIKLWGADIRDENEKQGLIGKIGNRGNQLRINF